MAKKAAKIQRQQGLKDYLNEVPFATDEELAKLFTCSIQTIRMDRLELGIPEVRERLKAIASDNYSKVRSLQNEEMVGQLISLELGVKAVSVLEVVESMVSEHSKVCRGHHIFAQANMLTMTLIDSEVVLTGSARIRFKRPVFLGEKMVATATWARSKTNKHLIKVVTKVGTEEVFVGKFIVVALDSSLKMTEEV